MKIFRSLDHAQGIAANLNQIGLVYGSLGQYEKALSYYEQALEIDRKLNIPQEKTQAELGTKDVPSLSQVCPKSVPRNIVVRILQKAKASVTIRELMNSIGQTNRTRFRKQVLKPLIEAELITMTIPDKPQSSKQRYVITDRGREILGADVEISAKIERKVEGCEDLSSLQ